MNATKVETEGLEWIVEKEKFFATPTGKNLAEFYGENILARDGKDRDESIREWMETFDVVRVRVYPEEERVCFAFLQAFGGIVDEHCEDLYTLDEIVADMKEALRERHLAPPPYFLTPHFTRAVARGPVRPGA